MQHLAQRSGSGTSAYVRVVSSLASAVVLTFFACQIYFSHDVKQPYKIGMIALIAIVGIAGIHALLTPEPDEPAPNERLYTADEVAALVAAVQSGRLIVATPETCKFCHGEKPEVTGVDGTRYHRSCFQAAFRSGKT